MCETNSNINETIKTTNSDEKNISYRKRFLTISRERLCTRMVANMCLADSVVTMLRGKESAESCRLLSIILFPHSHLVIPSSTTSNSKDNSIDYSRILCTKTMAKTSISYIRKNSFFNSPFTDY